MKHVHTIEYDIVSHYSQLSSDDQNLIAMAYKAAESAYAPYSKFHVGAAVKLRSGEVVLGNNQENIAYPSGLCAERVALFHVGATYPDQAIETLVVVAKGDLIKPEDCVTPCGACRQVIAESESRQTNAIRLILVAQNGKAFVFDRASDLLVFPFGLDEHEQ